MQLEFRNINITNLKTGFFIHYQKKKSFIIIITIVFLIFFLKKLCWQGEKGGGD
jgi:hypothetical protein